MIRSRLPPAIALSEAKEMLGPGTDTTSLTLAHILWGLAHDISFQDSLAADLALAHWPTDMTGLEALPRLRAAVKEGIRWAGAAAAMLPRIVPKDGATLAGKFIPGGVRIFPSSARTYTDFSHPRP
jgi:cytochrome P450